MTRIAESKLWKHRGSKLVGVLLALGLVAGAPPAGAEEPSGDAAAGLRALDRAYVEADPDYVGRVVGPAREARFPDWYLERLESFR